MAIYLGLRAVTAVLIWLASDNQVPFAAWTSGDPGYLDMTVLWDGTWYRRIAEHGYPSSLPLDADGVVQQNAWAFYPAFPLLARAVMQLTGGSFPLVGSSIALICGVLAAGVIAVLLRQRLGGAAAVASVAVWAAFPSSPTLQLAYTESLAILLLALFLLALNNDRWFLAGWLAIVIGFSRPIAAPLGLVVLVAVVMAWRRRSERPLETSRVLGMLWALGATAVAAFEWPAIAAWVTGVPSAYSETMAAWRAGHEVVLFLPWRDKTNWLLQTWGLSAQWTPVLLISVVILLVVAVLGPWATRLGPQLRTWCLAYPAYLIVVLDPFTSLIRYLLPLFPLAAVLVGGADEDGPKRSTPWRTVVFVVLGIIGQVWWINELLVFTPPSDFPP